MSITLPLDIFINKYFLYPHESAEREIADIYFFKGKKFDYKKTKFYKLRVCEANWLTSGFARIPKNLDIKPLYWVMPWADKYRKPPDMLEKLRRRFFFEKILKDFFSLADSIKRFGFDNSSSPIKGYLLHKNKNDSRFIYTDGNKRLGILSSMCSNNQNDICKYKIYVDIKGEFWRDKISSYPQIQINMNKYKFSKGHVLRWFDNAFF